VSCQLNGIMAESIQECPIDNSPESIYGGIGGSGSVETRVAIVRCPLLSLLVKEGMAEKPVYVENAEVSCELDTEASHLLLIPQDWTPEEGEAWLKKDAREWLEEEGNQST